MFPSQQSMSEGDRRGNTVGEQGHRARCSPSRSPEQYYLLRDNDAVTWPTANGREFLDELATFWRDWN